MLIRALVIAIDGRMSMPSAMSERNAVAAEMPPRIERDDAVGLAPLRIGADVDDRLVLARSGRCSGESAPEDTARAR